MSTPNTPIYFGDICTTGIFCGGGAPFGWGDDRILLDDFGVAIGPDGGARVAWTDARESHAGECTPTGSSAVSCQNTHLYFACQKSGLGLHGETLSACGTSSPTAVEFRAATAVRTRPGVLVRWRTASEVRLAGFNVYREQNGRRHRLNRTLIARAGGVTDGHAYSYADRRAPSGHLRYWVQAVARDGSRAWHGPLVVARA